ncbi:MAG: hypothetical protein M3A44_11575 [Gammaproteobacteria bacterium]
MLFAVVHAAPTSAANEFILFPEVRLSSQSPHSSTNDTSSKVIAGVDLFYAHDSGKLRLLGEAVLYKHEQEVERLQAGWRLQPETTLWLGRYHNLLGNWNSHFHHGAYFQTSISRPGIAEFEGEGGALQTHITGALLEGVVATGAGGLSYAVAVGAGSGFSVGRGLEPLDVLRPGVGQHRLSVAARAAYRADADGMDEAGVFASHARIPSDGIAPLDIEQVVGGGYLNWEWERLRLLSAAYWVRNTLGFPSGRNSDAFRNGYAQLEHEGWVDWTFYGRLEGTQGGGHDAYLTLFPDFVRARNLGGVRFDFMRRQSLKLEISNVHLQGRTYRPIVLQWSARFP